MARSRKFSPQAQAVIEALLEASHGWRHGYEISQATGLKSGTLYPILIRLADRGLLESAWRDSDQPGRPPRHVYRLTPEGLAVAGASRPSAAAAVLKPVAAA